MILLQLLAAVRRHPLVAVIGLAATVLLAGHVHGIGPLYQTQVSVLLLDPTLAAGNASTAPSNPFQSSRRDLVGTAGVVARMLDRDAIATRSGSDAISLVGMGVKSGFAISLPNSGGQWVYQFDKAELDVQVVGRTPADVEQNLKVAMAEIRSALRVRETQVGAPRSQWIQVEQSPPLAAVVPVAGNTHRATAMAGLLGLFVTASVLMAFREDRRSVFQRIRVRLTRRTAVAGTP